MDAISGKVAVITGGASGIGFATAKALAAKGAKLVIADIEATALNKAVAELSSSGAKAEGVLCDVADLGSVQNLAQRAFSKMGAVHILFNNAGVALNGHIVNMKHSDWEWIIKVDLWGPIHGVEEFLPRMIEQKQGGQILFTSSIAGQPRASACIRSRSMVWLPSPRYCDARSGSITLASRSSVRYESTLTSELQKEIAQLTSAAHLPLPGSRPKPRATS